MAKSTSTLKLNTGMFIPQIGLGTWLSTEEEGYQAVLEALKLGYRHIDTAAIYKNEGPVGKAIKDSGIPRDEIFVTTKLWGTQQREPLTALEQSLERLGLDYVDLYLMHWPVPLEEPTEGEVITVPVNEDGSRAIDLDWDFIKTWELMQELPETGKAKAVGVSNFSVKNLEELKASDKIHLKPAANQVECHPLLPQTELINYCQSQGIVLEAYSPLGTSNSPFFKDEHLLSIAEKYDASVAQVLINWGISRGIVLLPKSVNKNRIASNLKTIDLKPEDAEEVSKMYEKYGEKRLVAPNWGKFPIFQ
jgi:glycerol 2-dehydrogenase (NADP+)